eukprot:jgi/Galph1/3481/GphlegSOOS_G2176.1
MSHKHLSNQTPSWEKFHSLVDILYCSVINKLSPSQFFHGGWGYGKTFEKQRLAFLESLYKWKEYRRLGRPLEHPPVIKDTIQWTYDSRVELSEKTLRKSNRSHWFWTKLAQLYNLQLSEAVFPSPVTEWLKETDSLSLFPKETQLARFLLVQPNIPQKSSLAIHLAATGDHSYGRRLLYYALPLAVRYGISSVILENPYYGSRKPCNQKGSKLTRVQDLLMLGFATIQECISIAFYFSEETKVDKLCFTGISQGGLHAAMAASLYPSSVAVVSAFSPPSAVSPFTSGILRHACSWEDLMETMDNSFLSFDMSKHQRKGSFLDNGIDNLTNLTLGLNNYYVIKDQEKTQMEHYCISKMDYRCVCDIYEMVKCKLKDELDLSDIRHFPLPANPCAAILVAGENDQYVPKEYIETFSNIWPQMEIRWIPSGHVTGFLFYRQPILQAILDSLTRL